MTVIHDLNDLHKLRVGEFVQLATRSYAGMTCQYCLNPLWKVPGPQYGYIKPYGIVYSCVVVICSQCADGPEGVL